MNHPSQSNSASTSRTPASGLWKYACALCAAALLLTAPGYSQQNPSAGRQQSSSGGDACAGLARLSLPNATITMAQPVAAGEFKMPAEHAGPPPAAPGGPAQQGPGAAPAAMAPGENAPPPLPPNPAFCRAAATLKPTSDSDIKMEVWLPLSGWNGNFVGVSNMGLGGAIQYRNMVQPLVDGYAAAATDTGHTGFTLSFIPGHPEKLIDYAYRADHEMTLKAKALIKDFYGKAPKYSYWVGCSLGGVEALTEAYRYPEDYDGIVAGSPVNPLTLFNADQMYSAWLNLKYPDEVIPAGKYKMINEAAIEACAGPAGLKQGFVDDPLNCHFDPGTLLCKGADAPDCLTAPQLDFMKKLYAGPVNPRTGESIFPGYPYGSEALLTRAGGPTPIIVALELYKYMVMQDPNWDWKTMDYDTAIAKAEKVAAPIIDVPPDFTRFLDRGGKLMIYVGGAEQLNAKYVVNFYETALKKDPGKKDSVRLFINPGVGHCGGGNGCDTFEKLGTIAQWVESGKAPDQILSSKVSGGKTLRTRPLCAYPAVAEYKGAGDMDDAASFVCAK